MTTIILSIILIIINYGMILLAFKFFGRVGLFFSIPITIIIANLQVVMQIDFFSMALTLGNAAYASSYLITDLLGELYTHKDAQKGVFIGFFSMICSIILMNIAISFAPYNSDEAIIMHEAASMIFGFLPRIGIASIISYFISQSLDVQIFSKLKANHGHDKLWIRNNISTFTSQLIDNLVFTTLAFVGTLPISVCISIFISTYIVKLIISIIDTPFMYLGRYMFENKLIQEIDD